ncbi:MAG: hypothetical protein AAF989_08860 [Planctomycetota bacterium]
MKKLVAFTAPMILLLSMTGCMIGPLDGQHIGSLSKKVEFSGATGDPNEWIYIQAQHPTTKQWTTIGNAKTSPSAIDAYDSDWYYFSNKVEIPGQYWKYTGPNNLFTAEVRCKSSGSTSYMDNKMLGFTTGFWTFFDPQETVYTQSELWQFAGNGHSVTVTGTFYPK